MSGKLIRLFLVDGSPNGLRTVELSNMTIYTTIFPRTKLIEFLQREESTKAGCYILLGDETNESGELEVYIGEGENVGNRLKQHANGSKQKEFWNEVIVFTSKDGYITKTQIQYLESELCRLAFEAENILVLNANQPGKPSLSEVDTAEMKQFLDVTKLILSSVGISILDSKKKAQKKIENEKPQEVFEFSSKDAKGKMVIEEDQFVVLQGSTAVIKNRPSASNSIKRMREKLIMKNILRKKIDSDFYIFEENYAFNSPSFAASAISGGNENGRRMWKYKGRSMNQIEAEEIKNDDF